MSKYLKSFLATFLIILGLALLGLVFIYLPKVTIFSVLFISVWVMVHGFFLGEK